MVLDQRLEEGEEPSGLLRPGLLLERPKNSGTNGREGS